MQNAFKSDLNIGVDIEKAVLDQLKKKFPCAVQIGGKFKDYDIWIPEIHKSIEVKSDQKSQYTGNFLIECEMYGKPSALLSTKADYWVIYDGLEYSWYRPSKILECVVRTQLTPARFTSRGDTTQKLAYLVPVKSLKEYREERIK